MADGHDAVLILFNIPRTATGGDADLFAESDAGVLAEVEAVAEALGAIGIPVRRCGIRRLADLPTELAVAAEGTVFNLVESLQGDPNDFNLVPALCRAFGKACTGSDSACLMRCLDKGQTRAGLQDAGVPVAEAVVVPAGAGLPKLPAGPLIVKPLLSEASEGIDAESVFPEPGPALEEAVRKIHRRFGCAALVEQFIDGREVNISVIEQAGEPVVLPLAEIEFRGYEPGRPRIVGYRAKWVPDSFEYNNTVRHVPALLPEDVAERMRDCARRAWKAVGCNDYARVDFRLDADLNPYVLEVNSNPDISPDAGFAAALRAADVPYAEFVRSAVTNARARRSATVVAVAPPAGVPQRDSRLEIRRSIADDREDILAITAQAEAFGPDEVAVARDVLDSALEAGPEGHYQCYTALLNGRAVGWVCFGPTPCTSGTFDIYWVVVAAGQRGRGVGRSLMAHAEDLAARMGGRMVVVETSGRGSYDATRAFYSRLGYEETARVPDFYAPGDAKVVCTKRLGS
jgi:D-alanine-D-alanine ligase